MEKKNRALTSVSLENKKDHERFNNRKKSTSSGGNVGCTSNAPRFRRNQFNEHHHVNNNEIGSVLSQGSKKANYNHLLNFTYKSINQGVGDTHPYARKSQHSAGVIRRRAKLSKEMYLQATCQFVLKDIFASDEYTKNADCLVAWQHIEQVRFFNNEVSMCPICLGEPLAGRITKCGHIYCYSCVLHLLAVINKCAICDDDIKVKDFKSVVTISRPHIAINDNINMCLMKRLRSSVVALPVKQWTYEYSTNLTSIDDCEIERNFCKYLLISDYQIQSEIIDKEMADLQEQLLSSEESELMYIQEAITQLEMRIVDSVITTTGSTTGSTTSSTTINRVADKPKGRYHSTSSSNDSIEEQKSDSEYFFYQASSGEHVYLHSLNTRCLREAFGSLAQSPLDLNARVVEVENYTMTEELRRRFRFLSSLPLMSEFKIVELEFDSNLIPVDVLSQFSNDIKKRQQLRNKRIKEENKRSIKIQIEENKILGKYPEMKLSINNIEEFPEPTDLSPKDWELSSSFENKSSFSQMLRAGPSSFNSMQQAVYSANRISSNSEAVPSYKAAFSLDIQQALDNYNDEESQSTTTNENAPMGKKGKKKKKKAKLLFSTSMSRG